MPISVGAQLGACEITAFIGEGGMGRVFRARDTRLERDVAIKALPDAFAMDADRVARFQREAEALASLNHPHIAGIHDLVDVGGARFLALELVEGAVPFCKNQYAVSADGQRFLINSIAAESTTLPVTLILNRQPPVH